MIKRFFLSVVLYLLMVSFAFAGAILNNPMFSASDDNGDPLTGGLLYSYIEGTSTPKALYTDKACSVPDTNPVVLDSRGEAEIYGVTGGYKLVLKTAVDVTIWTIDNIDIDAKDEFYYFFPDSSQADQGAATGGGNLTVKDFVDSNGATKKATMFFIHDLVGNTTVYTFSTTETITDNITIVLQNGAYLTDDVSDADLTINGAIIAGGYQVIDWGTGSGNIIYKDGQEVKVSWHETLVRANSDIDSTSDVTLILDNPETISANLSIGTNIILKLINGAILSDDANNADLTFFSPDKIVAGDRQKIFDWGTGSGDVLFTNNGKINVGWWGLTDDGSTDNTAAFQAALDSMSTTGTGLIWFPGNSNGYALLNEVELIDTEFIIEGNGATFLSTSAADAMFTVQNGSGWRITINDLVMTGNANCGHGFDLPSTTAGRLYLNNVKIQSFTNTGVYAINSDEDHSIHLDKCEIVSNANGILLSQDTYRSTFKDSYIWKNAARQIYAIEADFTMNGCFMSDPASGGATEVLMRIEDSKFDIAGNRFEIFALDANAEDIIQIIQVGANYPSGIIKGTHFEYTNSAGAHTKNPIVIEEGARDVTIDGNTFFQESPTRAPVYIINVSVAQKVRNIFCGYNLFAATSVEFVTYDDATTKENVRNVHAAFHAIVAYQFFLLNVAQNATVDASIDIEAITEFVMPMNGWIIGLAIRTNAAITAGTLTLQIKEDGSSSLGDTIELNSTTSRDEAWTQAAFIDQIGKENLLTVEVISAGLNPIGSMDASIVVYVAHDLRDWDGYSQ
ncbi:hypothetical protein KAR91_72015 [Candidatus Pacearchaeota archaeon]|nr:hypothetical protein [Candidatus Pacearchaeota archaeon]